MTSLPSTTSMSPTPTEPAGRSVRATAPVDVTVVADQGERPGDAAVREQSLPAADDDREDDQPVLVDQAGVVQGMGQTAATVHLQLATGLRLQLLDRRDDVTGDDGGVLPQRIPQGPGNDVLRSGVQLCGHQVIGVRHRRPERVHHVVGGAAEQHLVGLGEPGADDAAEVLVDERDHPAALLESAGPILVRPAGSLHDAVEAEERVHCELHVCLHFRLGGSPRGCPHLSHERVGPDRTPCPKVFLIARVPRVGRCPGTVHGM